MNRPYRRWWQSLTESGLHASAVREVEEIARPAKVEAELRVRAPERLARVEKAASAALVEEKSVEVAAPRAAELGPRPPRFRLRR